MGDSKWLRSGAVWLVLVVAVLAAWLLFNGRADAPSFRPIGNVAADVRDGKVSKLIQPPHGLAGSNSIRFGGSDARSTP